MPNNTIKRNEPEDILAEVDKPVKGKIKSSSQVPAQITPDLSPTHRLPFVIGGIAVIIILIAVAGYLFLADKKVNNKIANANANSQNVNIANNGNANQSSNSNSNANSAPANANIAQKITNDADGDGLINEDEAKSGTDPKNPDTDGDGLSDREEVKVWKTNPLKADTDGDGYNDGQEIKTLNDPRVPGGKLLDLQKAIQQLNANK